MGTYEEIDARLTKELTGMAWAEIAATAPVWDTLYVYHSEEGYQASMRVRAGEVVLGGTCPTLPAALHALAAKLKA
jgi:hypothetical protein